MPWPRDSRERAGVRRPYFRTRRLAIQQAQHRGEGLDRAARDRIDDELDVPDTLACVRAHPLAHLLGRTLERWRGRTRIAALDATHPVGKAHEHGDGPLDRPWIRAGIATRLVDDVTERR